MKEILIELDKSPKPIKITIKSEKGIRVYKRKEAAKIARLMASDERLFELWLKYQ